MKPCKCKIDTDRWLNLHFRFHVRWYNERKSHRGLPRIRQTGSSVIRPVQLQIDIDWSWLVARKDFDTKAHFHWLLSSSYWVVQKTISLRNLLSILSYSEPFLQIQIVYRKRCKCQTDLLSLAFRHNRCHVERISTYPTYHILNWSVHLLSISWPVKFLTQQWSLFDAASGVC